MAEVLQRTSLTSVPLAQDTQNAQDDTNDISQKGECFPNSNSSPQKDLSWSARGFMEWHPQVVYIDTL